MKALQTFTPEQLERASELSPQEATNFLEQFRKIHAARQPQTDDHKPKSRLISLKVPENLLQAFKTKARLDGLRYQTQIKQLMRDWLGQS